MQALRYILFHGYSLMTALLGLLLLPCFALHPRGRVRLIERLGLRQLPPGEYLWFHGASMGEITALLPVLKLVRESFPNSKLLVTATSPTGLDAAGTLAHELRLLPFDSAYFIRRLLGQARIRVLAVAETELWPAVLFETARRGISAVLVNGIITDYTFRSYRRLAPLSRAMVRRFSCILCGTERSRQRFVELGADPATCQITGNSKYDRAPSIGSAADALALKRRFFTQSWPTLVLGSLRPGEEKIWFPVLARATVEQQQACIVVAPRHKEKFAYFAQQLELHGIPFERRSLLQQPSQARVLLLDTYGELEAAYSFSEAAFVGGSLVDWGGHNPLEPACYGACVAMGPFARNVREIVEEMSDSKALWPIVTQDDAARLLSAVSQRSPILLEYGKSAQTIWKHHRGASDKIISHLTVLLK